MLLALGLLVAGAAQAVTLNSIDRGNYTSAGVGNTNFGYGVGRSAAVVARNFIVFDLTSVSGTFGSATLRLFLPANAYVSSDPSETYTVYDVSTDLADIAARVTNTAIYADLGSGTVLGSVTVTDPMENSYVDIALDPSALAYINAGLGGTLGFGGVLTTLGSGNPETLFGFTTGSPASYAQLVLEPVVVPVPAAALLFTGALAAAGLVARRRAPDGALA